MCTFGYIDVFGGRGLQKEDWLFPIKYVADVSGSLTSTLKSRRISLDPFLSSPPPPHILQCWIYNMCREKNMYTSSPELNGTWLVTWFLNLDWFERFSDSWGEGVTKGWLVVSHKICGRRQWKSDLNFEVKENFPRSLPVPPPPIAVDG